MNKILVALTMIVMTGCATVSHSGSFTPSASLNSANFSYVGKASGQAEIQYFLIFGGSETETLVDAAKQNLIASTPLANNQALANITVNFKTTKTGLRITSTKTCIITADIVEFK